MLFIKASGLVLALAASQCVARCPDQDPNNGPFDQNCRQCEDVTSIGSYAAPYTLSTYKEFKNLNEPNAPDSPFCFLIDKVPRKTQTIQSPALSLTLSIPSLQAKDILWDLDPLTQAPGTVGNSVYNWEFATPEDVPGFLCFTVPEENFQMGEYETTSYVKLDYCYVYSQTHKFIRTH